MRVCVAYSLVIGFLRVSMYVRLHVILLVVGLVSVDQSYLLIQHLVGLTYLCWYLFYDRISTPSQSCVSVMGVI